MLPGVEIIATEQYVMERLAARPALVALIPVDRHFSGPAPSGTAFPYIRADFLTSPDLQALGAVRVWSRPRYNVYVVDRAGSFVPLEAAASEIDAALQGSSGTARGASIRDCEREAVYAKIETVAGVQYRHLGGRYAMRVQE
jgi:hypothetical protein